MSSLDRVDHTERQSLHRQSLESLDRGVHHNERQSLDRQSLDRLDRNEALWTDKNEDLLKEWMLDASKDAGEHRRKAKQLRNIYIVLSMLTSTLPVVLSGLTDIIVDDHILTGLLIFSGLMNACASVINPSRKSEAHFNAETRYYQLSTTIQRDLTLKKRERPAVDIYLERIMNQRSRIKEISPSI